MDYLHIVNAFKQQQQYHLLHQHQLQQKFRNENCTTNTLSFQNKLDSNISNISLWQPWRELQKAAVHHHLYQQQQHKLQYKKETRLTSKELPTTTWRRERRLRTGEYSLATHHPSPANSLRSTSPISSPPPNAHAQLSHISSCSISNSKTNMCASAHHISIEMTAAASVRPFNESTNISASSLSDSNLSGQINLGTISHPKNLQKTNLIQSDDAPLDMSVSNLKQRNSPPPPYRAPLNGSQFVSSLARPSVITQAPPKREVIRDATSGKDRENDNRSCESIDEHFRRSLGNEYFSLFSKRFPGSQSIKTSTSQLPNSHPPISYNKSPSSTPPLPSTALPLTLQSTLSQSEIIPPPAYPVNLSSSNHQQTSQQAYQNHTLSTQKTNNSLLSPVAPAAHIVIAREVNSPPLPLIVRPCLQQNHKQSAVLQKSSPVTANSTLTSSNASISTTDVNLSITTETTIYSNVDSRTDSPLPLQDQQPDGLVNLSHSAIVHNSSTSSPRHASPILNVALNSTYIKTEPGLQNVRSNNPTPPASPTSNIHYNNTFQSVSNSFNTSSPSSPKTSNWKPNINTLHTSAEVLASVDDHFAKALGDTWTKLQENKELRK